MSDWITSVENEINNFFYSMEEFANALNILLENSMFLNYYGKIFMIAAVIFAVVVFGMMISFYINQGQIKSYCKSIEKQLRDLQKGEKENGKSGGKCGQPVQRGGLLCEVSNQPADQ